MKNLKKFVSESNNNLTSSMGKPLKVGDNIYYGRPGETFTGVITKIDEFKFEYKNKRDGKVYSCYNAGFSGKLNLLKKPVSESKKVLKEGAPDRIIADNTNKMTNSITAAKKAVWDLEMSLKVFKNKAPQQSMMVDDVIEVLKNYGRDLDRMIKLGLQSEIHDLIMAFQTTNKQ